tara:strand:+ start:1848 stop:2375 length:528 start_codon:yes stop_codon:yes gene_type:complete
MNDQIKNFFKKRILKFIYKKELKNRSKKNIKILKANFPSILVIVDAQLNLNKNDLGFLAEIFTISDEKINFLWYDSPLVYDFFNHESIDIDDIDFYGRVSNKFDLFFKERYDVLINFYNRESIILKFLSLKAKHNFSIGFSPIDIELNDLVFDFNPNNLDILKTELIKYREVVSK